ncbi:hypothetical protein BC008_39230 [Mastigocoleus testarum BC008]|uniref:Acyltransferase 3 domain-containing protein n=2 Tax=Mastigocoleus TaxID=996924 RepID=A0A0V7ZGG4_9CYAN|nr:hypothetical protein BC008_39230 [Mastigocoleus testarum BC008]
MSSVNNSIQSRLTSIDALRGLAALIIVIYHARPIFWIGLAQTWRSYGLSPNINAWLGYATFPLSFGGLAVDLFFVLSGYCIHRRGARNLASNSHSKLNLRQFFLRRFLRIYPVYFFSLCVTAIVDYYIIFNNPELVISGQENSLFSFLTSLLSLQGLVAPTFGSNTVFWTLALEIHFYLFYPLCYYLCRRYGTVIALGFIWISSLGYIIVDVLINLSDKFPHKGSGGPVFLSYWFIWGLGFYLAEVEAGRISLPKKFLPVTLIAAILTVPMSLLDFWPLARFSSGLAFAGLLYWSISKDGEYFWKGLIGKWLSIIGVFSYSIYAIHRPVLLFFQAKFAPDGAKSTNLMPTLLATALALVVGWFFFMLVERWTVKPYSIKKVN